MIVAETNGAVAINAGVGCAATLPGVSRCESIAKDCVVLADDNLSVEIRELLPGFQTTVTTSVHPLLMNCCAYPAQSMVLDGKR